MDQRVRFFKEGKAEKIQEPLFDTLKHVTTVHRHFRLQYTEVPPLQVTMAIPVQPATVFLPLLLNQPPFDMYANTN